MATRPLVKGIAGTFAGGKVSLQAKNPGLRPAYHLIDVVRGISGRTTSKLEDETICLSVLLGLNLGRVTKIRVLHWRWRALLARLREFVLFPGRLLPRHNIYYLFADLIERPLRRSHEDRMKVFLSQFEFFPKDMLFWNMSRLQCKGWRWAPFSFLHKDFDADPSRAGGHRGYLTKEGLLVECRAIHIRSSSSLHGSDDMVKQPIEYEYLCIEWAAPEEELQHDLDPANAEWQRKCDAAAMVWKWVRLDQAVKWPTKVSADSKNKVRNQISDRIVILLEQQWGKRMKGALVSISKKLDQCICVNQIMTLKAVEQEPNQ